MNVHRIVRTLGLVIVLAAGCTDQEAPTWGGQELAIDAVSASRIIVSWPAAEGASAYAVSVDGEPVARLGPEARSYAADELEDASEHALTVQALDEAGNASTVLTASTTTLDATAPSFADGAELELSAEAPAAPADGEAQAAPDAPRAVVLRWPAATDNVAVTRYRVLSGGEELAAVDAPATSARVVTASLELRLEVRALDAAGNESAPGLVGTYGAPRAPDDARLLVERARAQVEQMLLGALGPSNGGFADVLREGAVIGNAEDVLAGVGGVGVASNDGALREGGGGGTPHEGSGGLGGVDSSPRSGLGGLRSTEQLVRARTTLGAVEQTGGAGFDLAAVRSMLRVRLLAIRRCYERELRLTPELAGTVRVRFTLEPTGAVSSALAVDGVAAELDVCVIRTVRQLRFDPGPERPASFEASVVFAPE